MSLYRSTGQPSPEIATSQSLQRFWWALLITLVIVFIIWGFYAAYPLNFILWGLALLALVIFFSMLYRNIRTVPKLEFSEVRRLIVCDQCGVETEGPYEAGDHVFRDVGKCPRCPGRLFIKAVYSIDTKTPLKRQQPPTETSSSKEEVEPMD